MPARVSVVGAIRVEAGGRTVEAGLSARRTRRLVAALAVSPGGLTAAELADRLWDSPPSTWNAALRGAVAAARTALAEIGLGGQELLVTSASGWVLRADREVDLERAAALSEEAREQVELAPAIAFARAEEALSLVDGEVLSGEDAEWIADLRRRRAQCEREALAALADAALVLGRPAKAQHAAERLVRADRLDEPAHRRLIQAIAASGDRAGAIRAFEEVRSLLADELGVDPSPETAAVYLELLRSGTGATGSLRLRPTDAFVGRHAEFALVDEALRAGAPVTLIGTGGIGKTRLALESAHRSDLPTQGGRYWVALGDLRDTGLVAVTIARAIGGADAADPLAAVVTALAPLGSSLLVLDACELVADEVVDAAQRLLEEIPGLSLLATSRAALGLPGERTIEVGMLDAATSAETLLRARLTERGVGRILTGASPEVIEELCGRVGGVPLAIELAAAQLRSVSPRDLADDLVGVTDVVANLIEQGYDALDEHEASLVRTLAVVDGTAPLSIVRLLVEGAGIAPRRVARLLSSLGESGLARVDRNEQRWRYGLDEHARDFARAATVRGERERVLAALFTALDDLAPSDATAPPGEFAPALSTASDAFRTVFGAVDAGIDRDAALDLAFRLHRFWSTTGLAEGRHWYHRLLDGAGVTESASLCRFASGWLAYWAGDVSEGLPLLRKAADELLDTHPAYAARALIYAAGLSDDADEVSASLSEVERAVAIAGGVSPGLASSAELARAAVLAERGDPAAVASATRAMSILPPGAPDAQRQAFAANAALLAWRVGDVEASRAWVDGAVDLLRERSISRVQLLIASAGGALHRRDFTAAEELAATALEDTDAIGLDREAILAAAIRVHALLADDRRDDALAVARGRLDDQTATLHGGASALALETAALLVPDATARTPLLATASGIRAAGSRPVPPDLAWAGWFSPDDEPDEAAMTLALTTREALALARSLLA